MPRTTIVASNRVTPEVDRFPALKMAAKDERQRIACLETEMLSSPEQWGHRVPAPWFEWVHRMEKPREESGVPMQKKIKKKDRDNNEYFDMVWDLEWVSSPICLGSQATIQEKGNDPGNCPVCAAALEHPDFTGLTAPAIRYAMPVLKYSTRPGGWLLSDPFGAEVLVWAFTEKRFARLDDLNRKVADRGAYTDRMPDGTAGQRPCALSDVDVLLGPCEDVGWQRFAIDTADGPALWTTRQDLVDFVTARWRGEHPTDDQLQLACGKAVTNRAYLDEDIRKTVAGWNKALHGAGAAPAVDPMAMSFGGDAAQQSVQQGMAGMAAELGVPLAQAAPDAAPFPGGAGVAGPPAGAPQQAPVPGPGPVAPSAPMQVPPTAPSPAPAMAAAAQLATQMQPASAAPVAAPAQPALTAPPTGISTTAPGGYGMEQFAPLQPSAAQAAPQQLPGAALAQAVAPDMTQLAAQQAAMLAAAGVPQQLLPQAVGGPVPPQAAPAAVPAPPAAPVAAPSTPAPGPSAAAPPARPAVPDNLFAAPAAVPAQGEAVPFADLAKF